ncbi:four helix bundle protein [Hymenobacter saemangeumensis]|uniref:Four helix bundle protein n=1 Tax=Hymenobacter saemangeumensis TaxID=1084522 RepID=A0ABP8IRS0_9BACT
MFKHRFKELIVWQRAMDVARTTYQLCMEFLVNERTGLTSQMRRSAISIPSNIAEGAGRGGNKEFAQFLRIANGSCNELHTQMILAADFGFINKEQLTSAEGQIEEVERLLYAFQQKIASQI